MPDGKDYIAKTYQALKDNLEGFNKTEQEYRQLISTDGEYRKRVYSALRDNLEGFNRTEDDFYVQLGVKKKSGGGGSQSGATGTSVDPAAQQYLQEVTQYLNRRKGVQQNDNTQLPANVKQAPDVLRTQIQTQIKNDKFEKVKQGFEQQKLPAKPSVNRSGTAIAKALQAKYGAEWRTKATPQEKNDYMVADSQERYDTRVQFEQSGALTVSAPTPEELRQKQIQKDADEFYDTPLGKLYWNVLKPVGGTAERIIGNTAAAGTRLFGSVTGTDEVTDGIADYIAEAFNPDEWYKDRVTRITPTAMKGGLFNNGKINTSLIVPKLAETLTTMYALTQGGGGNAGLFTRSFLITEEDYRKDGREAGLKGQDLDMYAYMGAGLTSMLEPLSPNNLITGKAKKTAAKEFYEAIQNGFSREVALKNATKTLVKETGMENVQEFTQMIADKANRYFTDKMSGKPVFNDDLSWEGVKDEVYETLFLTTGATTLLSSPQTLRNAKPTTLEKSAWYNAALNPDQFSKYIERSVSKGQIDAEQANTIKTNFEKYRGAVEQAQRLGFSADQTVDIAFNIYKGQDISTQLKQINNSPVLKEAVGAPLKQEQQEIATDIKRVGLGVPEVGTEITGDELSVIIGNIGDKNDVTILQDKVTNNNYRVDEINVKELYNTDAAFKQYVDEYNRKEKNDDGLLVPAIVRTDGSIVDGRSRLAQQYLNGAETVQVFKELKSKNSENIEESRNSNNVEIPQQPQQDGVENKQKIDDIEKRRQNDLYYKVELVPLVSDEDLATYNKEDRDYILEKRKQKKKQEDEINAKYDAELAALNNTPSGITAPQTEQTIPEQAQNQSQIDAIKNITWYRGVNTNNQSQGDKFYSASEEVAGDYAITNVGDTPTMTTMQESEMPTNPLVVGSKEDLADMMGFDEESIYDLGGDFDAKAKAYAQAQGHDAIYYQSGSMDEGELHVFEKQQNDATPTTPQPVQPNEPAAQEQGTETAVPESADAVGQGDAAAAPTVSPADDYDAFLNEMMDYATGVKDSSFEYRLDIPGMAQKERDGAVKDIRAGKQTKRRTQFEAAVRAMFDKKAVSVNRGKGSQSEFTEIPFATFFNQEAEAAAEAEVMGTWLAPQVEGWADEEITNVKNTQDETATTEQDAQGRTEQPQPETQVRGAKPAAAERGANEAVQPDREQAPQQTDGGQDAGVVPPDNTSTATDGFERKPGKKSLLNRAYEGTTDAALKERIAEFGLDYERQTWDDAKAIAKQIIEQLGIDAALNAVRKGMVKGAEAAFIWSEAIDAVGEEIASTTDPDQLSQLQQYEAELLDEFDRTARTDGRFLSALQDVYQNSDFGYKLSRQIEQYKERNNGEIPDEVRAKFEQLSIELEEANKKIAAKEEELQRLREQQAMEDIQESVERETAKPEQKKTNKQKAKQVADAIRKGKIQRPGIFLSSSPASAVWDAALEATAKAVEAGGAIADAIKAGITVIKQSDWYKSLVKGQQDEAEQTFTDYVNETTAKEKPKPSVVNGKIQIPHELIRSLVESGIKTIDELTKAVMAELQAEFPNITERQVRDAITNYGRVVNPNREEIEVEIRKIKRVGRVVSALEDIAEKKRPLRSGLQRDKLDAEERALQKELREALKTLPPDAGEQSRKLKTTLDGIKSRLKNQIEDIEREIATGEKRAAGKAEVAYDAEAKALRDKRDELKKVRDEIFGDEITDEQRIQRAIRVTQRAAEKLEEKIKAKDISVKQRSTVTSKELEAERKRLSELRDEMKKLREEAGIAEANRLASAKKRVENQIQQLEERLANKDFAKRKRTEVKADDELVKLKAEKLRVQEEFNKEQYKAELKNRTAVTKVVDGITEVWGLTRVLMATGELSFILIQGGIYTLTRPKLAYQSFKKMLSHFASEKRFNDWERYIKAQPYYATVKGSKLALSEYDSKLTAREELGVSGWANHIWDWIMLPVKGISKEAYEKAKELNPLKMIERAGVAYMNNMRLMRFLQATEKLQSEGKTFQTHPEDYKNVADVINTFSGRASLGPAEVVSKHLALIFFSPRNWVSIIKQTVPLVTIPWYASLRSKDQKFYQPSVAQKMAALDYMKYMTVTGGLLMAIAYMLNDDDDEENEVNFDPTSSDFMKIRLGNTRIDVFGGRTQMVVYQMRMLLDETTSTTTGKTSQLGSGPFTPTRFDLSWRMVQNKFAPTLGILTQYLQTRVKKTAGGETKRVTAFNEEYDFTEKMQESLQPIFWQTIRDVHKDQPETVAYFLDVLAAIGTGIQTYEKKKKKQEQPKVRGEQ